MPPCDCSQPAFFVDRLGKFNNDATLDGIAAANSPIGFIRLGKNVFMTDGTSLIGNSVTVGNASNVWQVYGNTVKTGVDAVIRNGTGPVTLPIADPFCQIPVANFTCGGQEVTVSPGSSMSLTPGVYGRVRVLNGGTLQLAQGTYTFCDVKMGREATIIAQGPVLLQIVSDLRIGSGSFFGPEPPAPPIAVYLLGRKVRISQGAHAVAQIIAPFAQSTFGRDAGLAGCFCSARAKSDKHITLSCVE